MLNHQMVMIAIDAIIGLDDMNENTSMAGGPDRLNRSKSKLFFSPLLPSSPPPPLILGASV